MFRRMNSDRWDLERLIHPFSAETFVDERFENAVLHVERGDPAYYGSLLSLQDIDRALTTLHLHHPTVHMANADKPGLSSADYTYPSGLIDAARLYQEYADGGSIVMNNLEGSLPSLMNLCRSMEARFSHRFQCNIYVTPAGGARGLATHFDSHDVFVLQISGTKHWTLYDTPVERPLRGQDFDPSAYPVGEKSLELDLAPGDMLYVPRGVMHDASSTDEDSCHITLGVLPNTWTDLLLEAVARAALEDAELRRSLPVGYASQGFDRAASRARFADMLQRAVAKADFDGALDHFAVDLVSTRHGLLYGQMDQIHRLAALSLEDRASPRPSLLYHLTRDAEHVTVTAYGGTLSMPVHAADPLEYALTHEGYRVGDLPGDLDDEGKIVLIRKLIKEGLVALD